MREGGTKIFLYGASDDPHMSLTELNVKKEMTLLNSGITPSIVPAWPGDGWMDGLPGW
jgi:hypothetical protein